MSGEGEADPKERRSLIQETQRASRILLDEAANVGASAEREG
jgi:hypothetical protein